MKRKLTLTIVLLALILAFTAGVVIAKPQPDTYLRCETACTVDAESGSTVNVWFLGSCSVMPVQMGIFILCN